MLAERPSTEEPSDITIKQITAPVINNEAVAESVLSSAQTLFPETTIDTNSYLTTGAEDMGYMQEKADGCYFFVGSANPEKGLDYIHHHPKFDFDERVLVTASALMASAAADLLK